MARTLPKCCWCGGKFYRVGEFYWCETPECRERQAAFAVVARKDTDGDPDNREFKFLFVPLPRQVEFEECMARNLLGGGAAGSTKSHIARWSLYRRAIRLKDYEALLLRETWDELKKHHFRLMDREADIFNAHGIPCTFSSTNKEFKFHETGAVIEGGHMESDEDVKKYLGRERDDIAVDEGVAFNPHPLLQLSTRARTTKPQVLAAGGARFRVYTNPGGPAASMLRSFFIDKEPDWEQYSDELKEEYDPAQWHYIPGNLDDNPYLPPSYQSDLAVLQPWRHQQLRYNDWDVLAGTFFTEFSNETHVKILDFDPSSVEWFRSLDWGYIAPGCVLWWAFLPDGVLYIRCEMKFSHATIERVVEKIWNHDEAHGVPERAVRYTIVDPALQGTNVASTTADGRITGEKMTETFMKAGMPVMPGVNDRVPGWGRIRELLANREEESTDGGKINHGPTLLIHPDCKYLIKTLAAAVSAPNNPEDIDSDTDDHAIDALRYGAMSRPAAAKRRKVIPAKSFEAHRKLLDKFRRKMSVR